MIIYERLLEKLNNIGIRGIANKWVRSFQSNRKQIVKIRHPNGMSYLEECSTTVGVPQGATISPILFIITLTTLQLKYRWDRSQHLRMIRHI
jgi:retron-type reverse transcriptase